MLPHSTIDVPYVNVKRQEKIEYIKNEKNQHHNKYLKSDLVLYQMTPNPKVILICKNKIRGLNLIIDQQVF